MISRYLEPVIREFLQKKMVFVGGPRQVGKTSLCLKFLNPAHVENPQYLNWDDIHSRALLKKGLLPAAGPLVVIDEVHKYKFWRQLIKGFYDKNKHYQNYLITGSARLDYYRRGGDSLMGRYRYLRLHPFSVNELQMTKKDFADLLRYGGFPEPFLDQSDRNKKLWSRERLYRIINDDISDLENLKEFSRIETLAETLESRVGSLLSLKSFEEDLSVSQKTIAAWMDILDRIYFSFRISPYGPPQIKALKKAQKVYLWDWSEVTEPGPRFENLVASQLLKYCHFVEDTEGDRMELRYLRDTQGREVDFVILKNKKPLFAVECKTGDRQVSKSILYYKSRTKIPAFYQVHCGDRRFIAEGVMVLPFLDFCKEQNFP